MVRYTDASRDSGVATYEIGSDYIRVQFSGKSRIYTYSSRKAGNAHVENMKELARNGSGLNSYINRHTKYLFD